MTIRVGVLVAVAGWALTIGGCADNKSGGMAVYPTATQQEAADLARDSRSRSYALAEMADRREREAEMLAQDLGPDHPSVEKKRRLAQELRAAAEEAEKNAQDLRRTVPHGMVQ